MKNTDFRRVLYTCKNLQLYMIDAPSEHKDKVARNTKKGAETSPEEYEGRPAE